MSPPLLETEKKKSPRPYTILLKRKEPSIDYDVTYLILFYRLKVSEVPSKTLLYSKVSGISKRLMR